MNALGIQEMPKGPYPSPMVPVSALSDCMRMESFCRGSGFLSVCAPQLGISSNLFVYWKNYPSEPKIFSYVADCEYEGVGEPMLSVESCPSLPGARFAVRRHTNVMARGRLVSEDRDGRIKFVEFEDVFYGPEAAMIQHEVDHMHGVSIDSSGERVDVR